MLEPPNEGRVPGIGGELRIIFGASKSDENHRGDPMIFCGILAVIDFGQFLVFRAMGLVFVAPSPVVSTLRVHFLVPPSARPRVLCSNLPNKSRVLGIHEELLTIFGAPNPAKIMGGTP